MLSSDMRKSIIYLSSIVLPVMLVACSDAIESASEELAIDLQEKNIIQIGGIKTDEISVYSEQTRAEAVPAETQTWLIKPLKDGLDITYGKVSDNLDERQERVAILKLLPKEGGTALEYAISEGGYACYSFNYRGADGTETDDPAVWYDNGKHYFQGVSVPDEFRYTNSLSEVKAANLTTKQNDDTETGETLGNYTLLSHYLSMPVNTELSATVSRVMLPFRHRLSRVLAYILIDPLMETKIKGYKLDNGEDDPESSSIRFCNVNVLEGVHDVYNSTTNLHTLTPQWKEARKVVPHFVGECGSVNAEGVEKAAVFYVYTKGKEIVYPTDPKWESIHTKHGTAGDLGYTQNSYSRVPCYDIIVQPTYSTEEMVMYDEKDYKTKLTELAAQKNKIDFEITLENGLTYEKRFTFDLNANYQTVVYLTITPEGVDYDDSGSDIWTEETSTDGYYGVNNKNGNTMSLAGSSWQRAYYATKQNWEITDGHYYYRDDENDAQYLDSDTKWLEYFFQAYKNEDGTGAHHGDYFILDHDITFSASKIPANFVFTGHLDAQNHKLIVTGAGSDWDEYIETYDYTDPSKLYLDQQGTTLYSSLVLYKKSQEEVKWDESNAVKIGEMWYDKTTVSGDGSEGNPYAVISASEEIAADELPVKIIEDGVEKWYKKGTLEGDGTEENPYKVIETSEVVSDVDIPVQIGEKWYKKSTLDGAGTDEDPYRINDPSVKVNYGDTKTPAEFVVVTDYEPEDLLSSSKKEFFTKNGDDYSVFEKLIVFYVKETLTNSSALFSGLNGVYETNQENANPKKDSDGKVIWEANVHKENNRKEVWLPYKDANTNTGWRAELLNLTVEGASFFSEGAVITGNLQNCFNGTTPMKDHIPAIPEYK